MEKKSIDYVVMEKIDKVFVLFVVFGWDDLGDWNVLECLVKGDSVNVELVIYLGLDIEGLIFYVISDDDVIVIIGLEDVVVVRDGNVILIVKKERL